LRGRLFAVSVLLLALFAAFIGFQIERRVGAMINERTLDHLAGQAWLAAEHLADSTADPDALTDTMGERTGRRFTVIAPDGTVLGDSERDGPDLDVMDDHSARPEIVVARDAGALGQSRRYSDTLGQDMLYTAVPVPGQGGLVVRVSMPADAADAPLQALRALLLGTCLIGLAVAGGLSALASHQVTRDLRQALARAGHGDDAAASIEALIQDQAASMARVEDERNRFLRVLDGMQEGLVLLDADGEVVTANRRAENLLQAQSLDEVPLVDQAEIVLSGYTVQVQVTQLEDGAELVLLRDVTDLKRLLTMRQDFVANVSHELRTPVSVIRTNVDALLAGAMDEPDLAGSFLAAIDRNATRLGALITDLLALARLDGGQRMELEPVDLTQLSWRVRESLWQRADRRRQDLRLEMPTGIRVLADPGALEQVLTNFVENAIKYSPEGSRIELRARAGVRLVRLEVHDDGPGVPLGDRDRVFERFYRVDKGRSRQMGGTGLGLSIVRHLAQAMGGRVGVGESPLGGSCFWLELRTAASS